MLKIKVHEIAFSFDQPDNLLLLLQRAIGSSPSQGIPLDTSRVLIIDTREDQAGYLARFLLSKGYSPRVAANALDAFTLFLQCRVVPFVIILGQEPPQDRFFLQRIVQQMGQRYSREPYLVRLPVSVFDGFVPQTTESLSPLQRVSESSFQVTEPLSPASGLSTQTTAPLPPEQTSASFTMNIPGTTGAVRTAKVEKISLEGQNFGRYQILSLIGEGPWSVVYRAYDRMREEDIALKSVQTNTVPYFQMKGSPEEGSLFQQEKELLDDVKHPNILPVPNCGKSYVSGSSFIYKTMPYCAAGSLGSWLASRVPAQCYEPREVQDVIWQLADALYYVHDRRITYQNFKLSNLLITNETGETDDLHWLQLMLSDFAIVQDGRFFSRTPDNFPFMAPEQWQGQSCAASDQYALAVVAYRLLAGRFPFLGDVETILQRMHMTAQPQPMSKFNPAVSPAIDEVVLRALLKRPQERFASVADFARAFQDCCG